MAEFRLRINYQKLGHLAYLSHLEIVRAMERVVRRSGLPYAVSQGFSVHMRHSFSSALPVATASLDEYMDLDMEQYLAPDNALVQLQLVALPELPILKAHYVNKDAPSLQVSHCLASYQIVLAMGSEGAGAELLSRLQTTSQIEVIKKNKPKQYQLDEYLVQKPSLTSNPEDRLLATLNMTLKANPSGALRPSAVLKAITDPNHPFEIKSIVRTSLQEEQE